MKVVIAAVIIIGVIVGSWQIWEYWQKVKDDDSAAQQRVATQTAQNNLKGMPPKLEPTLTEAQKRGADGLRDFLTMYGKTINDPRLAAIELDYVVLLGQKNIAEARRVFARVKQRTDPSSPNYNRVKQLEKTYDLPK